MKKLITLMLFTMMFSAVFAQNSQHKWAIGLYGGKTVYNGDFGNGFLSFNPFYALGGLSIDRYLNPSIDLGIQAEYGDYGFHKDASNYFLSTKTDGYLLLKYKFSNGYIFKEDAVVQPFLAAGIGMASYSVVSYSNPGNVRPNEKGVDLTIPVGLGIKLNFTKWLAFEYQFMYNFTNRDTRDGKVAAKNDAFASNSVALIFSFGAPKDTDKDGVSDKNDKCPNTPAGVAVTPDGCPVDTDKDGVADYLDKCPGTPAGVAVTPDGCPIDSDKDGVADYIDKCSNTPAGVAVTPDGCPIDSDKDGVADYLDKCPNTPIGVKVNANGCPLDSDGDGISDDIDKCPNTPQGVMVSADGCPVDTDGDGVPDYLDKCPTVAGIAENKGCPPVKAAAIKVFDKALRGIHFETAKAVIKGESFQILNDIVVIMNEDPEYNLEINGHTDAVGTAEYNQDLSQRRAYAVVKYLTDKGIDPKRMTAKGFGEAVPVADNDTPDGRALNRRVEFKVVF
jgi:outer membrane protein OmpA-like peptidoglycan-associated protein